jgi:hypothetical protein
VMHFFCVGRERGKAKREGHVWGEKRNERTVLKFYETTPLGGGLCPP